MSQCVLSLDRVSVMIAERTLISSLSLSLAAGTTGCLVGPSGCGKTTLLRAIAGLGSISGGQIFIGDDKVASSNMQLPPERRGVGLVFQDLALFPHLSVFDNAGFGLQRWRRAERVHRVREVLTLVGLHDLDARLPHQLSGGQQQRVALARAIAPRPRLLLMDECFSSLDAGLRQQLAADVKTIIKQQGIAGMLVTHDQSEALSFGDLLGVMERGHLHQWASPQAVYDTPASTFVAGFMGGRVAVDARCDAGILHTCVGSVPAQLPDGNYQLFVRPGEIVFSDDSSQRLRIVDRQFRGHHYFYTLQAADGQQLSCDVPAAVDPGPADRLPVHLVVTRPVVFAV